MLPSAPRASRSSTICVARAIATASRSPPPFSPSPSSALPQKTSSANPFFSVSSACSVPGVYPDRVGVLNSFRSRKSTQMQTTLHLLTREEALHQSTQAPLSDLLAAATELRAHGKGNVITFSKKVFIPLTTLCRDYCSYCTFRKDPG